MRSLKSEFISSNKKALFTIKPTLERNILLTQYKKAKDFSKSKTGDRPIYLTDLILMFHLLSLSLPTYLHFQRAYTSNILNFV